MEQTCVWIANYSTTLTLFSISNMVQRYHIYKDYGQLLILSLLKVYLCILAKLKDDDIVAVSTHMHVHSIEINFIRLFCLTKKVKISTPHKSYSIQNFMWIALVINLRIVLSLFFTFSILYSIGACMVLE